MHQKKISPKLLLCICALCFLAVIITVLLLEGDVTIFKRVFFEEHSADELRDTLNDFGVRGYITTSILSMLQVVLTVLPAEPIQVLAGIAFGMPLGIACCLLGIALGNTIVFVLYKVFGDKVRKYFMRKLCLNYERAATSKRVMLIIFALYLLPAIPYGAICLLAASAGMKYRRYITVTLLGSLPSIAIGVGIGHIAVAVSWVISISVFAVIVCLLCILTWKKEAVFCALNKFLENPPYSSKTTVQKCNPFVLFCAFAAFRILFFFCGIKIKYKNKLKGEMESPSIVLCNHGSFVDFVYAGTLLRKYKPHFVVARLYFCHKSLGWLLRNIGAFPKSMFVSDLESAKNCLRVLRNGEILAMMPEARLSTAGRFEDIQEGTFSFIKKAGVPVYSVKLSGDYLAYPKWGRGLRHGAQVEAELDILFTKEELSELSLDEIAERTQKRLYFDDYEWLKTKPKVKYRSRHIAEGLENILTTCPKCKSKFTLKTKGNKLSCECCGELATLSPRYELAGDVPFKNPLEWYDAQKAELDTRISSDESFSLRADVELFLPSRDGKKMLRPSGNGVCTLDRSGLSYTGTRDGESVSLNFPLEKIYRVLFGAGENFETYVDGEIHYFVPNEKRECVEWYMASDALYRSITNGK
jgi:uncharacterized membrane protein YdjX (TVP38/TMEM64 family)